MKKEKEQELLEKALANVKTKSANGEKPNFDEQTVYNELDKAYAWLDSEEAETDAIKEATPVFMSIEKIRDYVSKTDLPEWELELFRKEIDTLINEWADMRSLYTGESKRDIMDWANNNRQPNVETDNDEVEITIHVHDNKQPRIRNNKEPLEAEPDKQSDETTEHVKENHPKYKAPNDNVHMKWFNENLGKAWSWLQSEKAKTDEITNPKFVLTFVCDFIILYMTNAFPEAMSDELMAKIEILMRTWLDIKRRHTETHVTDDSTSTNQTDSTDNPMSSYMQELIDRDLEAVHKGLVKAAVENLSFTEDPSILDYLAEQFKQHSMETLEKLSQEPKSMYDTPKDYIDDETDINYFLDKAYRWFGSDNTNGATLFEYARNAVNKAIWRNLPECKLDKLRDELSKLANRYVNKITGNDNDTEWSKFLFNHTMDQFGVKKLDKPDNGNVIDGHKLSRYFNPDFDPDSELKKFIDKSQAIMDRLNKSSSEETMKLAEEPKSMATDTEPKRMTTSDLKKAIEKAKNIMDRIDGKQEETATTQVRSHNVGQSDYSKHKIQPWDIWEEYNLNPWDADIVKRTLRTKSTTGITPEQSRIEDYEKIIHVCQERIKQIKTNGHV